MSKLLVSANSKEHLNTLLNKSIDGVIIYLDKLSVNSNFYLIINDIQNIDFKNKEIFICINKIMHNSDLKALEDIMNILKNMNIRILFYDMAVYSIAKRLNMENKLVIYQDHLNASILSNKFYYNLGIKGSFITNDITEEELLAIKKNTNLDIFFLGYGYQPIFYSRRYLVTNYLKYIDEVPGKKYEIISDNSVKYPLKEEQYGTTIYTHHIINLQNYLEDLKDIDYLVLNSVNIPDDNFNKMVDKFIKKEKTEEDTYLGFFKIKTIYKVK